MVHDWNFTPCGCFVWANQMLDYDTNCANAVNSASAELVCLSVSSTKRANSFFVYIALTHMVLMLLTGGKCNTTKTCRCG